jgi:hypothetical protein
MIPQRTFAEYFRITKPIPPFSQWVSIVKEPFTRGVLLMRLSEWYEGRLWDDTPWADTPWADTPWADTATQLSYLLVLEYPQADEYSWFQNSVPLAHFPTKNHHRPPILKNHQ